MTISHKKAARLAGLFYLIVIASGLFAELFVRQALSVPNNAMATAVNIQQHEMLYRIGIAADLLNFIIGLPCVLIIYHLFKSANKIIAQLALIFVIIQTAIISINLLNQISPLILLSKGPALTAVPPGQLASLSFYSLELQAHGYGIGLVFFAFYCMLIGYLIYSSTLVPRILGILYIITGTSYLLNSTVLLLFPGASAKLFLYFAVPAFIGEISFCLWLLIKGVKVKEPGTNSIGS